jgi:hypothetical protein
MKPRVRTIALTGFAIVIALAAGWTVQAEDVKTPYPNMAPLEQYMMERGAEITLARTAAPDSISHDADVMVLGQHGYETAVKGKNGFVCMVERAWMSPIGDPGFWNPKNRSPICLNPAAVRSYLPLSIKKTQLVIATRSQAEMIKEIKAAFDRKELPLPESGAMTYMMSKQGYLNDHDGHWRPHLMFFLPRTDPATWGAGQPGAPLFGIEDDLDRMTIFFIPVGQWSDGTVWSKDEHEH